MLERLPPAQTITSSPPGGSPIRLLSAACCGSTRGRPGAPVGDYSFFSAIAEFGAAMNVQRSYRHAVATAIGRSPAARA